MIKNIKSFIWIILNKLKIGAYIQLFLQSGIKDIGWVNSYHSKKSIDSNGKPIPWNTYSYIYFIQARLKKEFNIFEYGSGNSTIWYSQKVHNVYSLENDKIWYEILKNKIPSNVKLFYRKLDDEGNYAKEISTHKLKFDIVIIDGRQRNLCCFYATQNLKADGVIVFDNSDLKEYNEGIQFLITNGFRKIDFFGLSPITSHNNITSVFYKPNNCLGI